MSDSDHTRQVYEDPDIVKGYVRAHAGQSSMRAQLEEFVKTVKGKRIIDIGCGPGHDTYIFSELGYDATGVDYSSEMIRIAKTLRPSGRAPTFLQGDMRHLNQLFQPDAFDAAWVCASLLHISPDEVHGVLDQIRDIVKPGGKVFICIKSGNQGERIVREDKYGKQMDRYFMFWEREPFEELLTQHHFTINAVTESKTTSSDWLQFFLTVTK